MRSLRVNFGSPLIEVRSVIQLAASLHNKRWLQKVYISVASVKMNVTELHIGVSLIQKKQLHLFPTGGVTQNAW